MKLVIPVKGVMLKLLETYETNNPVGEKVQVAKLEASMPIGDKQILHLTQNDSIGQIVDGVLDVKSTTILKWFFLSLILESLRIGGAGNDVQR